MAIKVNYDGLASDVSTLTTNVKSICDSLDTLNSVENIIPGSWTSPAGEKYRSTVESDLVSRVADLEGSLTGLIKMLVSISDSFNNLEGVIGNDLKSWYDGLNNNGKVLDILSNGLPTMINSSMLYNNFISNYKDNSTNDLDVGAGSNDLPSSGNLSTGSGSNDLPSSGDLSTGSGVTGKKTTSIADYIPENDNELYILDKDKKFIKFNKGDNIGTLKTMPYIVGKDDKSIVTLPFYAFTIDNDGKFVRISTQIDPNTGKIVTDEHGNYIKINDPKIEIL